jgi:hypothetical protein
MHNYLPHPAEVAELVVYLSRAYDDEKGTDTSRFRISSTTLRRISGRASLRDAFLDDWESEMYHLEWTVLRVGDHFGLIRTKAITGWHRVSSRRISNEIDRIREGDQSVMNKISAKLRQVKKRISH